MMPRRNAFRTRLLDAAYDQTKEQVKEALQETVGKITMGFDEWKDNFGRKIVDVTANKLGVSAFMQSHFDENEVDYRAPALKRIVNNGIEELGGFENRRQARPT